MFYHLSAKKLIIALSLIALVFIFYSCNEDPISSPKGNATFGFSSKEQKNTDGRVSEMPASVVVSIQDNDGKEVIKDKKVDLLSFGDGYTTVGLELNTGNYKVTKFLVLDSASHVIYATPLEEADLAQYVNDPLPIHFSITESTSTQVVPQVLVVAKNDAPQRFGYASFDFEVVEIPTADLIDLPVMLQTDGSNYDSVFITFSNSDIVKKQRLILNPITHVASGIVNDLQSGDWKIAISYFTTRTHNKESAVEIGSATINVTSTATNLFSDRTTAFIKDSNGPSAEKIITWNSYFTFYVFGNNNKLQAIITLPVDPLNPFFEISLLNPDWDYFYADRTFYHSKSDEPDSHYLQGSAAFENYNKIGTPIDYIDTTSFKKVTDEVSLKTFNVADCLVIFFIEGREQPIFYYEWDFTNSSGGRKTSANSYPTHEQMEDRRKASLR